MALFENFPYTNLHQLNLDWLVAEMKKVEDAIKYGPVISVNGLTGEVVLYQEANVRLPDVMNPTQTNWNIFRYLNGHVYGIEFDATGNVYQIEDQYRRKLLTWADIPPESGVISVNGKYGVVRLYGSDIQTSGDNPKTVMESIYDLDDAVTDINNSIDDLDELTSTLQTISNAIKNSLAYVENTNIATHNMTAGTYVLWNNGAYKVKAGTNIAIDDTLSSSNLDAIGTKGFINDLNDSISALNGKIATIYVSTAGSLNVAGFLNFAKDLYDKIPNNESRLFRSDFAGTFCTGVATHSSNYLTALYVPTDNETIYKLRYAKSNDSISVWSFAGTLMS